MPKDPIGMLGRMNAASLMMITPEFFKVRRLRRKGAAKISTTPARFAMKPERMTLVGVDIRFARAGNPNGLTVLFLSPLPQSILCYGKVWGALAADANLVALDLPGFGRSAGDMRFMTFDAQSAFLEKFISEMGLTDIHIVAPDVAMPVALHYVIHRNHKAASILVGDGPGILPSDNGSLVTKIIHSGFWRTMVKMTGARAFIAGAIQLGYLHYSPSAEEVADYVASYSGRIGQVCAWFKHYPEGSKAIDPHLDTLDVPVHVFWGDQDAFLTTDNAERLHKRLPKSALTIFENCGHFCYQDKGQEFTQLVQNLITGGIIWAIRMADVFYVSITGLQLKRVWHAPTFWRHAAASMSQAKAADGCLSADARTINGVHHTLTVWTSRQTMLAYLSEGAHLRAMKAFKSFATGRVYGFETATVPEWPAVHAIWLDKGRQV